MQKITHKRLLKVLYYSPIKGEFTWLIPPKFTQIKPGDRAGCIKKGRVQIIVDGRSYEAGPLIWFYVTGKWSKNKIDHVDRYSCNNSWINLREVTHSQNLMNRPIQSNNTSGYKGVWWRKDIKKWAAKIGSHNRVVYLGVFKTKEEAAAARHKAAVDKYGEFAYAF